MPRVTLGNAYPSKVKPEDRRGHHVVDVYVPDEFTDEHGVVHWDIPKKPDAAALRSHFEDVVNPYKTAQPGISRVADVAGQNCEGLIPFIHGTEGIVTPFANGHFGPNNDGKPSTPTWVYSDHPGLANFISDYHQCPVIDENGLRDIEDTHTTKAGPPGVLPTFTLNALFTNSGRVAFNNMMGGFQVTTSGQAQATSTSNTLVTNSTFTTNQYQGQVVAASVSASSMVFGNIQSNNNTSSASVLTVDRWYNPASPGGAAGSTPSNTATYIIMNGGFNAFWFMGLTANSGAPAAGDTSLTGEITTSGGGLVRKICTYAQTSGVSPTSYTLTAVYTANGSDSLPVTIAKIGVFCSMVVASTYNTMMFETLYGTTATLSASGDQLTSVDTITGS